MTQEQVINLVKNNHPVHYKKLGIYEYENASSEQDIVSMINGVPETKNRAIPGDYILTGISGEKYVVKPEVFAKRYEDLGNGKAKAIGDCWGNVYNGEPFSFKAPWGEHMICETGDYLVSPNAAFTEAYRIAKEEFEKMYRPVEVS